MVEEDKDEEGAGGTEADVVRWENKSANDEKEASDGVDATGVRGCQRQGKHHE